MANFADITINDGLAVANTFVKAKRSQPDSFHEWTEKTITTPIGFLRLATTLKEPKPGPGLGAGGQSGASRVYRVAVHLDLPTLESGSTSSSGFTPPPTVAYVCRAKVEFVLPERSNAGERLDLIAFLRNALNNSQVVDQVQSLTPPL